jgi:EH domain-containing protein 1
MDRENYIDSLRGEILEMVKDYLTPVALKYEYSDSPLETNIKWRPLVLVLGNYSSGKSTLINEFLGAEIQATGQAPTDDSFTILTYDESGDNGDRIRTVEERDGKFLLNDPEFPFESLKKHGQRFSSHFRLKKINSPFLKTIAVIDTPGMLDSITERDRGYNYQEVIGDFAHIADLVLILFDPHKAGTVREAYTSLRDTLPSRTFEDRMLFVLNRVDECESLTDLLRVYGTLCWNLSQMTGRKDIPMIHLTYSRRAMKKPQHQHEKDSYLSHLENQREELRNAILKAPRHRLDNLATFVEIHGERLCHLLEAMISYRLKWRSMNLKYWSSGFGASFLAAGAAMIGILSANLAGGFTDPLFLVTGGAAVCGVMTLWGTLVRKFYHSRFHRKMINQIDDLTQLNNQTRRDSWSSIRSIAKKYLEKSGGRFLLRDVRKEYGEVRMVFEKGAREIREALNELSTIRHESDAGETTKEPESTQLQTGPEPLPES